MKTAIRNSIPALYNVAASARASLVKAIERRPDFDHDGMRLYGKSMDWLHDPRFYNAYRTGMATPHHICRAPGSDDDIHNEYRVYMCCWAATHAAKLPGDFVECGVNTGITSVAICTFLDWNKTGKRFYLYDTFAGIPLEQCSEAEREARTAENAAFYDECYDSVRQVFSPWPTCKLVRGKVPETLSESPQSVAYLHLDMNIAAPEIAAIEHFWPRMERGGIVMLDDYGFEQYRPQKLAMDEWGRRNGVLFATLPTGQGMAVKY